MDSVDPGEEVLLQTLWKAIVAEAVFKAAFVPCIGGTHTVRYYVVCFAEAAYENTTNWNIR